MLQPGCVRQGDQALEAHRGQADGDSFAGRVEVGFVAEVRWDAQCDGRGEGGARE